jgi:YVTN family beta-propeller protein
MSAESLVRGCSFAQVGKMLRLLIFFFVLLPVRLIAADSYVNFESHQFRPVTISPDGRRLFVANTPDNRVEIFDLTGEVVRPVASVMVGLEPVAIAARNDGEIWVVNHLSDSVSIVDVAMATPRVVRTLLVGDEPRDIVFAGGAGRQRAYISAAHRGQASPYINPDNPGELVTRGIGRADVWVVDAEDPAGAQGGAPMQVISLFGDSPGPLAVSPDGKTVYVGVFKSGNQTTIVGRVLMCEGGINAEPCTTFRGGPESPGGLPPPNANIEGVPMPEAGLIVKWDGEGWKDELDRDWSEVIKLDLPDYDVFALDATVATPQQQNVFRSVGTILYALAVNPANEKLYVANTDAINEVRFEGAREPDSDVSTVRGHLHEARITVIEPDSGQVLPRHLNKHIDYPAFATSARVRDKSLSMPVALDFSADGKQLYIAAKGSDKVAVVDSRKLDKDSFKPSARKHIAIPGGGPAGLALDEARKRLYVLSRFDNSLVVVDTKKRRVTDQLPLFNPEPAIIRAGRPLFYNAALTSGNGESSCASCHVAGDKDELAWDLGDPFGTMLNNPARVLGPLKGDPQYHPMKGPMLTQTMRGVANHGPLHWRGDRTAGNDPGGDPYDTAGAMNKFNVAFVSLMGRDAPLPADSMQALTEFSLRIMPPPNPIRALDDSLTPTQARGKELFETAPTIPGGGNCAMCHVIDREKGYYGTNGIISFVIGGRLFKVPSHRNTYERVGMFGRAASRTLRRDPEHMGPQIRGYGFTHDGGADTVIRFASYPAFRYKDGDRDRRAIEQYLFAFEANLKPIVGQQMTLGPDHSEPVIDRFGLLMQQALAGNADLVAKGVIDGQQRGFLLLPSGQYQPDSQGQAPLSADELMELTLLPGQSLTLTAVPVGSGYRIGLDRNEDGVWDGDAGSVALVSRNAGALHPAP